MMDITIKVEKDGDVIHKPVFQSVQLVTKGAAEGFIRAFYMRDDPDVRRVVKNMAHAIVAWFAGYLEFVRKYTPETVKPPMESFEIAAVQLAEGSQYDVNTLTVNTEFPDREEWLEDMEEELGLEKDYKNEEGNASLVVDTKGLLGQLLRRDMTMETLDRGGVSKADGDDATSLGLSTNASEGVGDIARNHSERKRENYQLKDQARLDKEKMEKMRSEHEELLCQLQEARIGRSEGTQVGIAEKQQTETKQHGATEGAIKGSQMELEATAQNKTAAEEAGATGSETTGTTLKADANPNKVEEGGVENAEESQKKCVTFEEHHHGKT